MRHDRPFRETSNKSYERIVEFFSRERRGLIFDADLSLYIWNSRRVQKKKSLKSSPENGDPSFHIVDKLDS